jgi:hypothetical protein
MHKPFVPANFNPPKIDRLNEEYILVPIMTQNTDEDLQVILKNADMITKIRGEGSRKKWPYICTREENFKDLAWLELCAEYKQLFCYIIRRKSTQEYIGSVYIYPIVLFYQEKADRYDVDFSFWITESEYDKGKYRKIYVALMEWFNDKWPFNIHRIYFRNILKPE